MTEKKTVDMFIREVPLDVWEKVDRLCRRRGIKRREFIEQALAFFQEGDGQKNLEEEERAREARARADQIRQSINAYEKAISLKKKIEKIRKEIYLLDDDNTEMNMLLELKRMESEFGDLIKKDVPDHHIPDDFEERRKMGLPEVYCESRRIAISRNFDRGFNRMPEKTHEEIISTLSEASGIQEMKRKLEELNLKRDSERLKEKQKADKEIDTTTQENGVEEEPVKKENDSKVKLRRIDSSDEARLSGKKKGEIKTAVFGRGIEGLDGE